MGVKEDYSFLERQMKEMTLLGQSAALLNWDEEVIMPHDGIKSRGEQAAYLGVLIHEKSTGKELWTVIKRLKKVGLKGEKKLNVDKMYKSISNSRKIPKDLVEELARATTLGSHAWRQARKKKDFKIFEPYLKKIIEIKRKQASLIGLSGHAYNSLLDDFEEGMTVEKLKPRFQRLKAGLIELLGKIQSSERYKKQKLKMMKQKFDEKEMNIILDDITERMGLDKKKSRRDISEHPFTTRIGVGDVRITTAFRGNPMFSFGSTVHEAGHALYELNLPEKNEYNALGGAPSLGIHESQSRFWENNIAKSEEFWKHYFGVFKKAFRLKGNLGEWYREENCIEPGFIRVESDEVHYCLHVILRFEIELGLIDGSIKVKDLSRVWNEKFKESFGRVPKNVVDGVLQDVHWSQGYVGYFPTYAIGTMYAAMIHQTLKKKIKNYDNYIAKGEYGKIKLWLNENIHKHGSKMLADDIIKKAVGSGLDEQVYLKYLNDKYGKIYGF